MWLASTREMDGEWEAYIADAIADGVSQLMHGGHRSTWSRLGETGKDLRLIPLA